MLKGSFHAAPPLWTGRMYKRINKNRNNKTPLSASSAMLLRFWVFLNVNMNNCAIVHTTPSFIQFISTNWNLTLFWSSSFGCPFRPNGINNITISHRLIDVSSSLTHVAAMRIQDIYIIQAPFYLSKTQSASIESDFAATRAVGVTRCCLLMGGTVGDGVVKLLRRRQITKRTRPLEVQKRVDDDDERRLSPGRMQKGVQWRDYYSASSRANMDLFLHPQHPLLK